MTLKKSPRIYVAGHRGMVHEMVQCDLKVAKRQALLKIYGYKINVGIEK
jgi:predicted lipase